MKTLVFFIIILSGVNVYSQDQDDIIVYLSSMQRESIIKTGGIKDTSFICKYSSICPAIDSLRFKITETYNFNKGRLTKISIKEPQIDEHMNSSDKLYYDSKFVFYQGNFLNAIIWYQNSNHGPLIENIKEHYGKPMLPNHMEWKTPVYTIDLDYNNKRLVITNDTLNKQLETELNKQLIEREEKVAQKDENKISATVSRENDLGCSWNWRSRFRMA